MKKLVRIAAVVLLALVFVAAGVAKLTAAEKFHAQFAQLGLPQWFVPVTGAIELLGAALIAIPREGGRRSGAALLAAVMAVAASLHLINDQLAEAAPALALMLIAGYVVLAPSRTTTRDPPTPERGAKDGPADSTYPEDWRREHRGTASLGSSLLAVAESAALAAAYIGISLAAVRAVDLSFVFPEVWTSPERTNGSAFLVGAITQVSLVLLGAYLLGLVDLRRAISLTFVRSTGRAWIIAVLATAIHLATILMVVLPQPERVWEASSVNLALSVIPAADGWTQEVIFRGYVLLRLARGNLPGLAQILLSGILFAAIHIGYAGEGFWQMLSPLMGTFMLGCFYAWSVRSGRGSLMPVVCCHILIILVSQPWLALAR